MDLRSCRSRVKKKTWTARKKKEEKIIRNSNWTWKYWFWSLNMASSRSCCGLWPPGPYNKGFDSEADLFRASWQAAQKLNLIIFLHFGLWSQGAFFNAMSGGYKLYPQGLSSYLISNIFLGDPAKFNLHIQLFFKILYSFVW